MRKLLPTVLILLVVAAGAVLLTYPSFSEYRNARSQTRFISLYENRVAEMSGSQYQELLAEAHAYNERLRSVIDRFALSEESYYSLLNPGNSRTIMGYLEIPSINVTLGIYHGTGEDALQVGVGHMEGSSLPVGGESTHAAVSGHRGLPSAELLSNLDAVQLGDMFYIYVLDEKLTYEVDAIAVVDPGDLSLLRIEQGRDLVTLVTCTPYGVNTQRLLVRGSRVRDDAPARAVHVPATARMIDFRQVASVITAAVFAVLLICVWVRGKE